MKRWNALLLCMLMLLTILSGCGTQESVNTLHEPTAANSALQTDDNNAGKKDKEKGKNPASSVTEEHTENKDTDATQAKNASSAKPDGETAHQINEEHNTEQNENPNTQNSQSKGNTSSAKESSKGGSSKPASQTSSKPNKPNSSKPSSSKPKPVTPTKPPNTITVHLSVDCNTAVAAGYELASAVSDNGIILPKTTFIMEKDATVYDLLKKSNLVVASSTSAMGVYVSSIQSLAEKACGSKSGWQYTVNGKYIGTSCDKCVVKDGDVVAWRYTCNNGKDLS